MTRAVRVRRTHVAPACSLRAAPRRRGTARAEVGCTRRTASIETPVFMPVGTAGSVKALTPGDLRRARRADHPRQHLPPHAAPRAELGRRAAAACTSSSRWDRPMLTDSGGFQVFTSSRAAEDHRGGRRVPVPPRRLARTSSRPSARSRSRRRSAPTSSWRSTSARAPRRSPRYLEASLARTTRWAAALRGGWTPRRGSSLFGIVQGGCTRICAGATPRRSARSTCPAMRSAASRWAKRRGRCTQAWPSRRRCCPGQAALPDGRRHARGSGPRRGAGMDMFDCVLPTRCARNGLLFTSRGQGRHQERRARARTRPLDPRAPATPAGLHPGLPPPPVRGRGDPGACALNTIHNLHFFLTLMADVRAAQEDVRRLCGSAFRREPGATRPPRGWRSAVERKRSVAARSGDGHAGFAGFLARVGPSAKSRRLSDGLPCV